MRNLKIKTLAPSLAVLCLLPLLAGRATSQETVTSLQDQTGRVNADQILNVEVAQDLVQAGTTAVANAITGGTEDVAARVRAQQKASNSTIAVTTLNGTNTGKYDSPLGTPVYLTSQATGNAAAMTTVNAKTQVGITQSYTGEQVYAETGINAPNNSIYESGQGFATATANQTMLESSEGRISGSVDQSSNSYTQSRVTSNVAYSPSPSLYQAQATQNYLSFNGKGASSLDLKTSQTSTETTEAYTSVQGRNLWHPQAQSDAAANVADLGNHGGALEATTTQSNRNQVLSTAAVSAGQWSDAYVTANATGNTVYAGNEDIYVKLDNTQFSEGGLGIKADAVMNGGAGYDAYLSATATGNAVTSFACSECQANLNISNSQTNGSDVNATTIVNAASSRAIVSNAQAIGNSATFYVTGKH
jgi:hypothetical protein